MARSRGFRPRVGPRFGTTLCFGTSIGGYMGIRFAAAATPLRIFLSHTSDLGKPDEPGSFVVAAVAAVLRARPAVTDRAY